MASQSPGMVAGRVYLRMEGRIISQCVGVSYIKNPSLTKEFGLDDAEAQEITPGPMNVSGSIGLTRRIGDGGAEGLGFSPPRDLFVRKKYSTLELVDGGTGTVVWALLGTVTMGQESWQMQAKGMMSGAVAFESTRSWLTEASGAG